jgi:hypothetical protein
MTRPDGHFLRAETLFKYLDQLILSLSPRKDIFLLRLIAAVIPVVLLAVDGLYDLPLFYRLAIPFYVFCLALYAYGLLQTLLLQRQVSAELLIVLVMAVTLIDGKPLSGALVAWFIGFGLYISFTIIRRNRQKIERLVKQTNTPVRVCQGDAIREVPVSEVKKEDLLVVPLRHRHSRRWPCGGRQVLGRRIRCHRRTLSYAQGARRRGDLRHAQSYGSAGGARRQER